MEPQAKLLDLFDSIFFVRIRWICSVCGVNYLDPNFRPWLGTYFFTSFIAVGMFSTFYTIYAWDLEWKFKALTMLGSIIQGHVKYYTILIWQKELYGAAHSVRRIVLANRSHGTARHVILMKWTRRFDILLNCAFGMYVVVLIALLFYPVAVYIFTGEREYPLPVFAPFIDPMRGWGFPVTVVLQATWVIQGCVGLAGSDTALSMQILQVLPLAELIKLNFSEMDQVLERWPNNDQAGKSKQMVVWLRNLVLMHKEFVSYIDISARIFSVAFFCDVYCNGLTMCFIIFCLHSQTWIPLYCLFLLTFAKLFVICILGTIVEVATDRILETIQNSKWHLLSVPLKKHIMLMVLRAQHPALLMAGTVPMNLDLFVSVMKNVYSVAMILADVVD